MARLIVRGLEANVKARLKQRAAARGHSMEEEIRLILRNAVKEQSRSRPNLGTRIAARFAKIGLITDVPELHGQPARSAKLGVGTRS